ncbi:MAG: RNA 2',3'-cyclic phosphodiesterase [Clostridiales bacterium]|nr:RNA 2',3'-cyclic phosphodiesterase [Clostridiales bacterium]
MRLFIGIALPDNIREKIGADADKLKKVIPGRYVVEENYHITLVFIGETDQNDVNVIKRAMDAAVIGQAPVDLSIGRPWYFRKPENAILHMKVEGWKQLLGLDKRLRSALREEGLSFDKKPFNAHITLARKARINLGELNNFPEQKYKLRVNEITLFHSTRVNGVLKYLPIYRAGVNETY